MSLAAPLFLFGLFALAIPIIVHLSRRRTREAVAFPSLMFIAMMPYRSVRRRKLRDRFLLLLRCLALSLLVLAFARPLLRAAPEALSGASKSVVLLLDSSLSMGYGDRLERGLEAARARVAAASPNDRVALITFAEQAHAETQLGEDHDRLRLVLDRVALRPEVTRYESGAKLARSLLLDAPAEGRELVLISDLQRGDFGAAAELQLPPGTAVAVVDVAAEESEAAGNLAISGVTLERSPVGQGDARERVAVVARVVRRGPAAGSPSVDVELAFDGRSVQRRTVELGEDAVESLAFEPHVTAGDRYLRGTISVGDDLLEEDNVYRFTVAPSDAIIVLLVEGNVRERAPYVEQALRTGREPRFEVLRRSAEALRADEIARARVVVLETGWERLSASSRQALVRAVEGGTGLLVALGAGAPGSLAELGMGPLAAVEQSFEGRSLAFVDYDHPVFQPFAASRSGDFSSVRLYRYRAVPDAATSGAGAADPDQVGGGRVLARFDDGRAALAEHELGSGRVVAWGSSLDAEWGDLVVAPVFVPWIDRVVRYLADFEPPQLAYTVGEVARLEVRAGVDELAVLHPNGESERVGAERELLLALTQTGFYEVRPVAAADGEERVVAVNPQAAESDLTRLDPEELLVALTPSETAVARTGDGTSASTGGHEQRWWWYVMMAALAILIVEGWMANRKGRSLQASDATPELISASVS